MFIDELKVVAQKNIFSGSLYLEVEDKDILEHGQVRILNKKGELEAIYNLIERNATKLTPGNYLVQIYYPGLHGKEMLIFEKPVDIFRWKSKKLMVKHKLSNSISVELAFPPKKYLPSEQISLSAKSSKNGYLWLFSLDGNNFNPFFPNRNDMENRIKAGTPLNIPSSQNYVLKTRSAPGKEVVIAIVTKTKDYEFALKCLSVIAPEVKLKISLSL